ncbi:O-antigen ligase family protein [Pannonibacter anstelovis]
MTLTAAEPANIGPARNNSTLASKRLLALWLAILVCWPLGAEQLFPPLILLIYIIICRSSISKTFPAEIPFNGKLILAFLFLAVFSAFRIQENIRVITFTRDFMIWATALFFLCHFYACSETGNLRDYAKYFSLAFWFFVLTSILYVAFPSFEFPSIAYLVSPSSITDTMMGKRFLMKSLGEQLYFLGFTDRVSSIFGSPIHLACLVVLLLPFAMAFRRSAWSKGLTFLAALFIVFFAQARLAMIMLLIMPIVQSIYMATFKTKRAPFDILLLAAASLTFLVFAAAYFDEITSSLSDLFFERRRGSAEARGQIYSLTWNWFLERPFIGYGTQIDVPELDYPLGSHSTPLGLMFKHGIIAATLMITVLISTLMSHISLLRGSITRQESRFHALLCAAYTCYLMLLMLNEFIVDVYHTVILFVYIALVTKAATLKKRKHIVLERNRRMQDTVVPAR